MVTDREDLGFRMKVGYVRHQEAPGDSSEGLVLDGLEGLYAGRTGVREPDGSSIGDDGFNKGLVGEQQGLLLVAPGGTSQGFQYVKAL